MKLTYEECETEYNAARTVECYQRLLNKGDQKMVVFDTLGTPGAYAVIGRMAPDNVVLAQYGYGRTDAADGPSGRGSSMPQATTGRRSPCRLTSWPRRKAASTR